MAIKRTRTFGGKVYQYSGIGHRDKRSAITYANDVRRRGRLARIVGNKNIGWFVYIR